MAPKGQKLHKGNVKILFSGKVVGDLGKWNVIRDRRHKREQENKFKALEENELVFTEAPTNISSNANGPSFKKDSTQHNKKITMMDENMNVVKGANMSKMMGASREDSHIQIEEGI